MLRFALLVLLIPVFGSAQTRRVQMLESYDAETFGRYQDEGRTIVLQFHSLSCDLCIQQEVVLKKIAAENDPTTPSFFQAVLSMHGNLAMLYSAKPSMLLVFRGKRLIGRETGLTNGKALRELISRSLMKSRGRPLPRSKREFKPKR